MVGFKIIIIGGGPAGLAMAHCLRLAGIDYVLFEQRDTIADREGAGISIMPHVLRILQQFGMWDEVQKWAAPMSGTVHVMGEDRGWRDKSVETLAEKFGYNVLLFERYRLVKLMLEALPDIRSHIRTSKTLQSITEHKDGVSVKFHDGTTEHGSIVVGADGVHSKVRKIISEMSSGEIDAAPFTSFTRGLYGHGPRPESFNNGEVIEKHHEGWAIQVLNGNDRTYYFIYEKLKEPTKKRKRFTKDDAQEFVKPFLNEKILGDVTIGELWERRDVGNMRHLEQGVSQIWSRGRIVLVGDSTQKVTPNLGIGGNIGIESAACLANHLHALLQQDPHPDTTSLAQAFSAYQEQRLAVVTYWYDLAFAHMRFLVLDTKQHREMFEQTIPSFGIHGIRGRVLSDKYLRNISQAIKLDYVPLPRELEQSGTYPWADGPSTAIPKADLRPKL